VPNIVKPPRLPAFVSRVRESLATCLALGTLVLVAALTVRCSPSTPSLAHSQSSSSALASAVLDAIERQDETLLRDLVLSEQEFRDHVWPDLPAAQPERNLPISYVWGDLRQKSQAGLASILAKHGGHRYELVGVRFDGASTRYTTCEVHRDTVLTVRDETGTPLDLKLFGSSVEQDGRWKVFSFVID
jgi:hypothetical protein